MIKANSINLLCGTSCVGKTQLINLLKDEHDFVKYECSAFTAVKEYRPGSLADGKADYARMMINADFAMHMQTGIFTYFKDRYKALIKDLEEGLYAGKDIVVERSMFDPLWYTLAYSQCITGIRPHTIDWRNWPPIDWPLYGLAVDILEQHKILMHTLKPLASNVEVYYIPINSNYPYDMLEGVRPPEEVRDNFQNIASSYSDSILENASWLLPNEVRVYASMISADATETRLEFL